MGADAVEAIAGLECLFNPRSIAIIGATPDSRRVGGIALDHLLDFKFEGEIYPINPKYDEISGLTCYADIQALPTIPDLVVLAISAKAVLDQLRLCHAKGVVCAVIYASGFAEDGDEGALLQDEIVSFAEQTGMVISGPNCMGHANLNTRAITAFATLFKDYPPPKPGDELGHIGLVTQSGNLCAVLYALGVDRGVKFNHFINTGNEACLEYAQYLEYLSNDPETHAVIGYVEGLRNGERFVRAAKRFHEQGKPLVLLKSGESAQGAQATMSHTAAMAGDKATYYAAFRQMGIMRASDPTHLIDLAYLSGFKGRHAGRRVGVASVSGAMGAILTDLLVASGVEMPTLPEDMQRRIKQSVPGIGMLMNPIDLTAQIFNKEGVATEVMQSLVATDAIDTVLVYATGFLLDRIADEIINVARTSDRLIVAIDTGKSVRRADLEAAGIPVFMDVERCTRALSVYLEWCDKAPEVSRWNALCDAQKHLPVRPYDAAFKDMDEYQAKVWLASHGVPVPDEAVVQSGDAAVAWADQAGGPVALKILSPDIPHKTEVGGVVLGLQDGAEIQQAYSTMQASTKKLKPNARIRGALVQRMESGVCELIMGIVRDPIFGPVMTVGLGGVLTEVFHDVSHRVLPIDERIALDMLSELRGFKLMTGFRNKPKADIEAACAAIVALSNAGLAAGDHLLEIEINPLLVRAEGKGVVALDALLISA